MAGQEKTLQQFATRQDLSRQEDLSCREGLARAIFRTAYLQGQFRLRSGQTSTEYFDKYRFEADPSLLSAIAEQMQGLIPPETEVLAGLEMGGVPVATALSLRTGLPALFVRKKAKEYGTCQFAEGGDFRGKKLLIVEDVITTGGQVLLSVDDLRKAGAIVEHVVCVIDRGGGEAPLAGAGLSMHGLFTMSELKECGQ
jgi:orotate phosphoribosyltransferase